MIRSLSLDSVEAGADAVARSTLSWALNSDSKAESVQRRKVKKPTISGIQLTNHRSVSLSTGECWAVSLV